MDTSSDQDEDSKKPKNQCKLIWEGTRKTRYFNRWLTKVIQGDPGQAKDYLTRYGCQNFWDLAVCETIFQDQDA